MGSQSPFGYFVHSAGTDLYFHPFPFRPHYCDMEWFVTVAFRDGKPVAQAFRVGLVHVCHNGVYLPAFLLFFIRFRIDDDTDCKEIVDALERCFLFLNFIPDGMNGFGASFDVELQAGFCHFSFDRFDKGCDVLIAGRFCFIQFVFDEVICIPFGVF